MDYFITYYNYTSNTIGLYKNLLEYLMKPQERGKNPSLHPKFFPIL